MIRPKDSAKESHFYVIFQELDRLTEDSEAVQYWASEELDEIEKLRKIVMEVSAERPRFLTST